jgi:hypothetical protein
LSHAAAPAEVALSPSVGLVVHGTIMTTLPRPGLLGGGYTGKLVGTGDGSTFGRTHVTIDLRSNATTSPTSPRTNGTMIVRSADHKRGETTMSLQAFAFYDLRSGTVPLSFTTETATGAFAHAVGSTGTLELIIKTEPGHDGIAEGTFTMHQTS